MSRASEPLQLEAACPLSPGTRRGSSACLPILSQSPGNCPVNVTCTLVPSRLSIHKLSAINQLDFMSMRSGPGQPTPFGANPLTEVVHFTDALTKVVYLPNFRFGPSAKPPPRPAPFRPSWGLGAVTESKRAACAIGAAPGRPDAVNQSCTLRGSVHSFGKSLSGGGLCCRRVRLGLKSTQL